MSFLSKCLILMLLSLISDEANSQVIDSVPDLNIEVNKGNNPKKGKAKKVKNTATPKVHPDLKAFCACSEDKVDDFTGDRIRTLNAQPFFQYTPEEYAEALGGEAFVWGEAAISQRKSVYGLTLYIRVLSPKADNRFGGVTPMSTLDITFMNSDRRNLLTYKGSSIETDELYTYYQVTYVLNKSDKNALSKKKIDKVRLNWDAGFQEFEVYDIDLLIRQFECWD